MFLEAIAQEHMIESMEGWNEGTQSFDADSFVARIDPTDRFLSNFNRPLRRRMMLLKPSEVTPTSGVFRHPPSGEVYLLGQRRSDSFHGEQYNDLIVCHMVTEGGSSGLATHKRKGVTGPSNDPGWLVESTLGTSYMDLEFRTSANEQETVDLKVANLLVFAPFGKEFKRFDILELHSETYRVIDVFYDSGFTALRVDQEADPRIDFVITTTSRVYNSVDHEWTETEQPYNVSGMIVTEHDFSSVWAESEDYVDIVVEKDHIGIVPKADMVVTYDGRDRKVAEVSTQSGTLQYRLRCK